MARTGGRGMQGETMKSRTVDEILLPYSDEVPRSPSVTLSDRIIYAIEVMVSRNLSELAVLRNRQPIGMIRLSDALRQVGLQSGMAGRKARADLENSAG